MTIPIPQKSEPEVQAFISRFLMNTGRPDTVEQTILVDAFGDTPPMADQLLDLVLAGTKTATCMSSWAWDHEYDQPLVPGMLSVITDGAGVPRCVVETTHVRKVAYKDVTAEFARAEGEHDPADLPDQEVLDHWREGHWAFYLRTLPPLGFTPTPDMPVLCERFKVIYREPPST